RQEVEQLTVKNEDEEKPQLSEVHRIKSEDSRETEASTSSSAEQMKTESDGEISGGSEPDRELGPNPNLLPNIEDRHSASFEIKVSDESKDDNLTDSGSENEDSDEDWREPRTRQSGVNSKVGRKAAKKTFSCTDHFKQFVRKQICSVEKKGSRGKKKVESQMGLEPGRKSFSCDDCGKTFQKLGALKCHVRIYRCEKSIVCEDCGKIFHSRCHLKTHHRPHSGERPFVCDKCGKRFSRKPGLQVHMTCHTGEKPFQCEVCDKKFTSNGSLTAHMTIHKGEKPFRCSDCGRCFRLKDVLKSHMITHSNVKPFVCGYCGATFTRKQSLLLHVRLHTGENQLSCDQCDKKFVLKSRLLKHMQIHQKEEKVVTGKGNFACEECGRRFVQKRYLKSHMLMHTGEKPFSCDLCLKIHGKQRFHTENSFGKTFCTNATAVQIILGPQLGTTGESRLNLEKRQRSRRDKRAGFSKDLDPLCFASILRGIFPLKDKDSDQGSRHFGCQKSISNWV
uniref:C2H2-type domain-containing protein n=1 Tax=Xiphophorus maculatus TaxID=8083 RepID=A0A3B5QZL8_XIPMA